MSAEKPGSRILICEDDPTASTLLRRSLELSGYICDVAASAAQARELLAAKRYAALTLDLILPDEDSIRLIGELRERVATRALPIVVVSVKAIRGREALAGAAVGVLDWLDKPVDEGRLLAAVRRAVRRAPAGRRVRVLHVEDDPNVRETISAVLGGVAHVDGAGSLREARDALVRERFDVVLLDLLLPDGYGMELLPLLNLQKPAVPVVVFSIRGLRRSSDADKVAAALLKSGTGWEQILDVVKTQITSGEAGG